MMVTVTFQFDVDTDDEREADAEGWLCRMQRIGEWPNGRRYHPVQVEVENETGRVLREPGP
jgi:hypothetical protein